MVSSSKDFLEYGFNLVSEMSVSDGIEAALCVLALWFVSQSFYSVTFHPLSALPGPWLCAITRIPYWIQLFRGNEVHWLHDLHNRYGTVLRFGPDDLSYISSGAWKEIYGNRLELSKAPDYGIQPANAIRSLSTTDVDTHRLWRRMFAPAFSEVGLRKQQPIFKEQVELTSIFSFATFDIMADLCFGQPLGLLERDRSSAWVNSIFKLIKLMPLSLFVEYYNVSRFLYRKFEPKCIQKKKHEHFQHSAQRVHERVKTGSTRPDIWKQVSPAGPTEKLSLNAMCSNAELFMLAGTETIATLLSGLIYHLCLRPEKLELLKNEIRASFDTVSDLSFRRLSQCAYLNACIKEGLRIYPPVAVGVPRVVREGGMLIDNCWVPEGTRLSVAQYAAYHSEKNFRDANAFIPERWLPRSAQNKTDVDFHADPSPDVFHPFSYGSRDCLGRNLALHEIRLIMGALLVKFDFELCEDSHGWEKQLNFLMWVKGPLFCRVSPAPPKIKEE
ncbi:cytochrome P450 [Microdochium trichocladiopsis]|uniref:Cytochrome P450 n=1 Tax=Microdochium trichocladiopsis TaxID=1682393 RepID=A0A9P8XQM6_9PEZI|nr:cytochrome P450 [Microdochium trichocladiopsis]KAH7007965.1 cytochrome P450 [Microdochium trichocladiopsis]